MNQILGILLIVNCILALAMGIQLLFRGLLKYAENRMCLFTAFSSALWSVAYGLLYIDSDYQSGLYLRVLGVTGAFLFLISAQLLVSYLSQIPAVMKWLLFAFTLGGTGIYFQILQRNKGGNILSMDWRRFSYDTEMIDDFFVAYSTLVAISIFIVTVYMLVKSPYKRVRKFASMFLIVELLIISGMVLDMRLPVAGLPDRYGSSIMQFWGMVVLYIANNAYQKTHLNMTNLSEFIYFSLNVPVLVYDKSHKLRVFNDATNRFMGLKREDLQDMEHSVTSLFDLSEGSVFAFEGESTSIDTRCLKNNITCNLTVSRITDPYGDDIGFIVVITDLSEREKTLKTLREAKAAADEANREKSKFLANMSHEIRTPMNAIVGFSELLMKEQVSPAAEEYIKDIRQSSNNMLAIINDILDISKIESGKIELACQEYYVNSLMRDVALIIGGQAKNKGLDFTMQIDESCPGKLYGDKVRIRQMLINLLNNAIKYTNEGSVRLDAVVLRDSENAAVGPIKAGEEIKLIFTVSDTGIGIRDEDKEKIFESFTQSDYRNHAYIEGTGLGLPITRGFARLMGGDISVRSKLGEGSEFVAVIRQKVVDPHERDYGQGAEDTLEKAYTLGQIKIHDAKILVVDDNVVNLKVIVKSLAHYGLTVDTAESGPEAIEKCKTNKYNIIFMDHMMPEMDGTEAMKKIREMDDYYSPSGEGKIVVLTANAVSGAKKELIDEGFDEYIGKPINYKRMENIFKRFLPAYMIEDSEEGENGEDGSEKAGFAAVEETVEPLEATLLGADAFIEPSVVEDNKPKDSVLESILTEFRSSHAFAGDVNEEAVVASEDLMAQEGNVAIQEAEESVDVEPVVEEAVDVEPAVVEAVAVDPVVEEVANAEPSVVEKTDTESAMAESVVVEKADTESVMAEAAKAEPVVVEKADTEPVMAEAESLKSEAQRDEESAPITVEAPVAEGSASSGIEENVDSVPVATSQEASVAVPPVYNQSSKQDILASMLPSINVRSGIRNCGGYLDDYIEILGTAYTEARQSANNLIRAYVDNSMHDYAVRVHAIKGTLLNIGANQLGEFAKALELAGKSDDEEYVKLNHTIFLQAYRNLVKEIHDAISSDALNNPITVSTPNEASVATTESAEAELPEDAAETSKAEEVPVEKTESVKAEAISDVVTEPVKSEVESDEQVENVKSEVSSVEVTEPVITEEAQGSKEKADEEAENTIDSDEKVEDLPEIEKYASEQDIIRKIMAACKDFDFPTINKYIDKIRYEKLDIMKTEIYLSICEMSDNMMNEELYNLLKDYLKDTYGEEAEPETPVGEGPQHLQNE